MTKKLHSYLYAMTPSERRALALACGTSAGHLHNVAHGYSSCSPALAMTLERESGGNVSRRDLRPDWRVIWPEEKR